MLKKLMVLAVGLGLSLSALAVDVATLTKKAEKGDVKAFHKILIRQLNGIKRLHPEGQQKLNIILV